jgi:predicted SnoaL-like aldol condensation-catalyzing enzyme
MPQPSSERDCEVRMSSTANESGDESVVREWFRRVWNQLDTDAIDELFAPDGVAHWLDVEPVRGPTAFREFHRALSSSFRNIHVEVVREIQVGDLVAFQAEVSLVSVGQEIPVTFNGGAFARVHGRQIVETWDSWNFLGLLEGMGALPQGTLRLALAGELKVARGMA